MIPELNSTYVDAVALPWVEGGAPGIQQKRLFEDRERGMRTALIRWAPGASLPLHRHLDYEQTYVIEGSLCDDQGECKAGQYVSRPPGSEHRAWSPHGCLLLAVFLRPNMILEGPKANTPSW